MLGKSYRILSLSKDSALRRGRGGLPLAVLLAALMLSQLMQAGPPATAEAIGSLRIDPVAQTIGVGQSATVTIVQTSDVTTLGAQTNFVFNPAVVQITSVEVGAAYTDALFLYGVEQDGSSASIDAAIASANGSGALRNLATFFTPGSGAIPPGDTAFVTIGLTGTGGGSSALELIPLDLSPVEMLDEEGNPVPVSGQNGEIIVTGGAPPPGEATPAVAAASASPASATPTPATTKVPSKADASISVTSESPELAVGAEAKLNLKIKANIKVTQAQLDITFDPSIIEITALEVGPDWNNGKLSAGTGKQSLEEAIAEANTKGELVAVDVVRTLSGSGSTGSPNPSAATSAGSSGSPSPSAVAPSETAAASSSATPARSKTPAPSAQAEETFMVATVKGLKNGTTDIKLKNAEATDENNESLKVTTNNTTLVVGEGGGGGSMSMGVVAGAVLALGALGGGGAFAFRAYRRRDEI